jgi:hypothetical protein
VFSLFISYLLIAQIKSLDALIPGIVAATKENIQLSFLYRVEFDVIMSI